MQGVLTDGDIRRGLSKGVDFLQRPVCELMTKSPKTITEDKLAAPGSASYGKQQAETDYSIACY